METTTFSNSNGSSRVFYAHSDPQNGNLLPETGGRWQELKDHLQETARLARQFAEAFEAGDWGYVAGLWHDLGKYAEEFQNRLRNPHAIKGRDHSTAGAALLLRKYQQWGEAAALAIEGHHIGLQHIRGSWEKWYKEIAKAISLDCNRDRYTEVDFKLLLRRYQEDGLFLPELSQPKYKIFLHDNQTAAAMLDVRMLFSALVDADFVNTEAHFNGNSQQPLKYRPTGPLLSVQKCKNCLNQYIAAIRKDKIPDNGFNVMRDKLRKDCLQAARQKPGLFTLTAPTGSGKTLAMLSFALSHAARHGMRRIIMVMPFLNIIDQTAQIYREKLFTPDNGFKDLFVLEDHSLAHLHSYALLDCDCEQERYRTSRLLAENWDAPIILTTNVKCLESLMSHRPGKCRKLHRMAKSVILFDEMQTLPSKLAVPTLATLARLADPDGPYHSTVVFSTATQPAFEHLHEKVKAFNPTGWQPREIVQEPQELFKAAANRIRVQWRHRMRKNIDELAEEIKSHRQVLCIVNLKQDAVALTKSLTSSGYYQNGQILHLSTSMCPAHRRKVLRQVEYRLNKKRNLPVTLISTQCVEAGVDLDFPVVYRALAPLESIAQAAGRCNRHNRNPEPGMVIVFRPKTEEGKIEYPPGYKEGVDATVTFLNGLEAEKGSLDDIDILHNPVLLRKYYKQRYQLAAVGTGKRYDEKDIFRAIESGSFVDTAKAYKLIEQNQINILTSFQPEIFEQLCTEIPTTTSKTAKIRQWITQARQYTVSIYRPKADDPKLNYLEPIYFTQKGIYDKDETNWYKMLPSLKYDNLLGLCFPEEDLLMV